MNREMRDNDTLLIERDCATFSAVDQFDGFYSHCICQLVIVLTITSLSGL